ncbi:hypothetical protein [Streptomyces chattanoogensis]|uniref:hypothetical protein n=1 Tax=Streptomyces chattanoogensis TaxID=66876 RepID=UPI0006B6838D
MARSHCPRSLTIVLAAGSVLLGTAGATAPADATAAPASGPASVALPRAAVPMAAAPYEYLGWGDPQKPTDVMAATGTKWFTLAFILSDGGCNPKWDGSRALTGGSDESAIRAIRAKGGDVVVSAGGWSGAKLGEKCGSAGALAGAYQKVVDAYHLRALDIDIENTEFANATVRKRVVDALKTRRPVWTTTAGPSCPSTSAATAGRWARPPSVPWKG